MKKIYFLLFFIFIHTLMISQTGKQNMKIEKNYSEVIEKIVSSKKYDLVGDYFQVQEKPIVKYAKVFKLYKGWGYIDINGNEVIETKYKFLTDFHKGICKVIYTTQRKHPQTGRLFDGRSVGLMNIEGTIITKNDYEEITFLTNYDSQNIYDDPYNFIVTRIGNKKGLITKQGWEILPAEFDEIRKLKKAIIVQDRNKCAFAKLDGSKLTDFIYDNIKVHKNFVFGEQDGGLYLINQETGKHLSEEKFEKNYNLSDYDNNETNGKDIDFLIMRKGEKYILLSKNGKSIIESKYLQKSSNEYYAIRNNSKIGIINNEGKLVIDSIYDYAGVMGKEDVIPTFFGNLPNKKNVYFDKNYKELKISAQYYSPRNGRITFYENNKWGIMDEKGKILFPATLDYIEPFEHYDFTIGKSENFRKNGLLNRNGKIILPFIYDEIYYWGNKYNEISKDKKWGLITYDGKITVPIIYKNINRITNQDGNLETLFIAEDNNGTKLIDNNNKIIISNLQGGFSEVKQTFRNQKVVYQFSNYVEKETEDKGPFGLKSKDGKIIFTPQFDKISDFQNGFACAEPLQYNVYNDSRYLIDTHGNKIYLQYIDDNQRTIEESTCTKFINSYFFWNVY